MSAERGDIALRARALGFSYGEREVLRSIDLDVREGEMVAVVGANGAGKSTLLSLMLGFLEPERGRVELMGESVQQISRRHIAQRAAFVPQGYEARFAFTVREMVAMGRTPWLGRFEPESADDRKMIDGAMGATDVAEMAERHLPELSGGERQRVLLARAFAQATPVLVLDEPTSSLDLRHAYRFMELVREGVDDGAAAIAAVHDLTLAARFCDRIVALHDAAIAADGAPADVLTPELMRDVFGVRAHILEDDDGALLVSVAGPA